MQKAQRIFRFAPSPNGELHLGHAYSALLNKNLARACGGKLLLRIEDIDTVRCTPKLEHQMLKDLEWIGFEWDETPRRQSDHFDEYRNALKVLLDAGLLYPSVMSRKQIASEIAKIEEAGKPWHRDPDGSPRYPGNERELSNVEQRNVIDGNTPYSLRLDMTRALAVCSTGLSWQEYQSGSVS